MFKILVKSVCCFCSRFVFLPVPWEHIAILFPESCFATGNCLMSRRHFESLSALAVHTNCL